MAYTNAETMAWLQGELEDIQKNQSATLNCRLNPSLESCNGEEMELVLRYPLSDWQVNGLGTLHGGITCTMMDLTMSMAVYCFSRQTIPPTISMSINYLRPVPMEEAVLIRARVTSLGRRNATAYCEAIVPRTGKVACTAIGTYAIIPKAEA